MTARAFLFDRFSEGFTPLFMTGADMQGAFGAAHDAFDHGMLGLDGGPANECMAFGAYARRSLAIPFPTVRPDDDLVHNLGMQLSSARRGGTFLAMPPPHEFPFYHGAVSWDEESFVKRVAPRVARFQEFQVGVAGDAALIEALLLRGVSMAAIAYEGWIPHEIAAAFETIHEALSRDDLGGRAVRVWIAPNSSYAEAIA